jgi:hypothetical protein
MEKEHYVLKLAWANTLRDFFLKIVKQRSGPAKTNKQTRMEEMNPLVTKEDPNCTSTRIMD